MMSLQENKGSSPVLSLYFTLVKIFTLNRHIHVQIPLKTKEHLNDKACFLWDNSIISIVFEISFILLLYIAAFMDKVLFNPFLLKILEILNKFNLCMSCETVLI